MSEHPVRRRATSPSPAVNDSVDAILAEWAVQRPDLDFSPVGIITRLARVRGYLDAGLLDVFTRHTLTAADFQVIVTLRRSGEPYQLAQSRLMARMSLTSGTISVRLERLTKAGIVTRSADPQDKRGALVTLTDHGLALFDSIAPEHLANEDRLLSALSDTERDTLAELLRRLLVSLERGGTAVGHPLGIDIEPAAVARQRRIDIGLSDTAGLLVANVIDPSLAAQLRRGDLLLEANGRPLLSEATLAQVIRDQAPDQPITLRVLRGNDTHHFTVDGRGTSRTAAAVASAGIRAPST